MHFQIREINDVGAECARRGRPAVVYKRIARLFRPRQNQNVRATERLQQADIIFLGFVGNKCGQMLLQKIAGDFHCFLLPFRINKKTF